MLYSSEKLVLAADYDSNTRDWYAEAKANPQQVVITDPYVDAITGKLIVGVSKVMKDGKGVVTLDLDLDFLEEVVSPITIGNEGYTFVFDNNGNVLYHPTYKQNESMTDIPFYQAFIADTSIEAEQNGETVYVNRYYNELMNWQIGSIYPYSEVRNTYSGLILPVVGLNALCIILLMTIFYWLMTKFLQPLQTITTFAQKVAEGNLKERVEIRTEDEMGKLSASFNHMTTGLKQMIHSVDDTSNKLSVFSTDVSASIEENVQSIHQVVENIQLVADEVRKLAEQTNASASEIQALVATIQKTGVVANQSMETSSTAILEGTKQIESASTMFDTIHNVMTELAAKVRQTEIAMASLQERKEQAVLSVAEITTAIQKVSDNVEQVAATTEEQNASMEQMAIAAEQLAQQAKDLQQTIRRFDI